MVIFFEGIEKKKEEKGHINLLGTSFSSVSCLACYFLIEMILLLIILSELSLVVC